MSEGKAGHAEERARWRAQVREEVLWPAQRICDAHHHLWNHAGDEYFAAELAADVQDGHNVVATVYAECGSFYRESGPEEFAPVGETEFVVAQDHELERILGRSLIRGIVGFADLTRGSRAEDVLRAQIEAGEGRFSGVRHAIAWDPHPDIVNHQRNPPQGLAAQPAFIEGVRLLGTLGLTYDAWLYHPQIPEFAALAKAAPDTVVVLDHLGAPVGIGPYANRSDEILAWCRTELTALAKLPNVRVKLGGIGMTVFGKGFHRLPVPPDSHAIAAVWGDHIRFIIDTFGPARCLFESNFPPDRRSCSYRTLWNAFKRIAEPYSQAERDLLFHDTAQTVYRFK